MTESTDIHHRKPFIAAAGVFILAGVLLAVTPEDEKLISIVFSLLIFLGFSLVIIGFKNNRSKY
jgi:hypothetical protein